jgi:hypothetical protein
MSAGAVICFEDNAMRPKAEIMLGNGEHVELVLDRNGVTISRVDGQILFEASAELASRICASLVSSTVKVTPLAILAAVIVQIPTADKVYCAFHEIEEALV